MIRPEKYFDELYEYVDLWAGGFVKAYLPNTEGEMYLRLKGRVVESLLNRFDTINALRRSIGLDALTTEEAYDYYVNNMPEFDEARKVVDLYNFDLKTRELFDKQESFSKNPNAQAYLLVMGAPDIFIDNSSVVQERLDHINRLLVEGGYNKISPQKTEEVLSSLLMTTQW